MFSPKSASLVLAATLMATLFTPAFAAAVPDSRGCTTHTGHIALGNNLYVNKGVDSRASPQAYLATSRRDEAGTFEVRSCSGVATFVCKVRPLMPSVPNHLTYRNYYP